MFFSSQNQGIFIFIYLLSKMHYIVSFDKAILMLYT